MTDHLPAAAALHAHVDEEAASPPPGLPPRPTTPAAEASSSSPARRDRPPLLEVINLSRSVRVATAAPVPTAAAPAAAVTSADGPATTTTTTASATRAGDNNGGNPAAASSSSQQQTHLHQLWRGISFSLEPGDVLFVSGPSGVGKTLLLRALALLDPLDGDDEAAAAAAAGGAGSGGPSGGPPRLLLRGQPAAALGGPPGWRSRVLYVHQGRVDFPGTPRELLREVRAFCAQRSRRSLGAGGGGGVASGAPAPPPSSSLGRALASLFPFLFSSPAAHPRRQHQHGRHHGGDAEQGLALQDGRDGDGHDDNREEDEQEDDDDDGDGGGGGGGSLSAEEKDERRAQALLSHAARRLGLNPRTALSQPWAQLSGGQAQRASLALALALRPKVVLLDEPTSACDAASARRVERLLKEAARGALGRRRRGRGRQRPRRPLPAWLQELERGLPPPAPPAALVWVTHDEAQALRVGGRVLELPSGETGVLPLPPPRARAQGQRGVGGASDDDGSDGGGSGASDDDEDWDALFGAGAGAGGAPRVGSSTLLASSSRASLAAAAAAAAAPGGSGGGSEAPPKQAR